MNKDHRLLLEEIIDTSYNLLIRKLAHGGLKARNESAFQLEFGHILKTIGQLYEFRIEDKFNLEFETYLTLNQKSIKSRSFKARVDLLLTYQDDLHSAQAAIELKFFKKENHRKPNNRYDVFKDISNLEMYKKQGIDLCYFILATDHAHYCSQEKYSPDTADFDFRDQSHYSKGKVLQYKTQKPYGDDIILEQDYSFHWDKIIDLNFLKIKV
ncbi:hypothetical protein [Acinetobacter sp. Marseille-Q1618]|uniref:hypothetical protein n=1 Tax=Acinetobacter sp. Marseille-Q1618 TaxID=2697502 RepID=UPI00156F4429|nr:hypothetical protein [Acinetobacter sp. Marseille-Q1618]